MTQEQATTEIVVQKTQKVEALELLESKRAELKSLAKESEGLKVNGIEDKE